MSLTRFSVSSNFKGFSSFTIFSPPIMTSSTLFSLNPSLISPKIRSDRSQQSPHRKTSMSRVSSMSSTMAETSTNLASVWREIQGSGNWDNLVQPLNPLLREEIIRYGKLVNACYKAFDLNPNSKRYLKCKYGRNNMFREIGMDDSGYEVTKYIYATPDISIPTQSAADCSHWIGYVAVSTDDEVRRIGRRDIVIKFRGTVTVSEWIANLMSSLTPARLDPHDPRPDVKVQSGFLNLYTSSHSTSKFGHGSCREQLLSEVSRIIDKIKYEDEEVSVTIGGHSLGSSIGLLLAYDIAELGLNRDWRNGEIPITVYSFGGPRVGNSSFKERLEELGVKVLRVANVNDPITKVPGVVFNENFRVLGGRYELPWSCSCYAHVGVELVLDFFELGNPSCVHDLETYIGLLRCPRKKVEEVQTDVKDFVNKAIYFLNVQVLDSLTWEHAALARIFFWCGLAMSTNFNNCFTP